MAAVHTSAAAAAGRAVAITIRAWGLSIALLLLVSPAYGTESPATEMAPSTAFPAWTRAFSRLPDEPMDADRRPGPWWEDEPALARALTAADTAPPGPDWKGLARDTAFLVGYQIVATGVIFLLPESVSGWSDEAKSEASSRWVENVQDPTFDTDSWFINYVMHPYWGATYYIRARERGLDEFSSFAYSVLASTLYEFGVEAFFEKPSIQDLVVTPVAGSLLAAFVFEPIRTRIMAKSQLAWYDHAGLVLTDPLGTLNGFFERLFGIKSSLRVTAKPSPSLRSSDRAGGIRERTFGLELSIPWK
jgi:Domain of unknown function (DUF3943)